jgi:hypothetical protein
MKERRSGALVSVVFACAILIGFASASLASEAFSSWYRFFGPTDVGGNTQCADQRASVSNTSDQARGHVRARYGATCANSNPRPAGHLGTQQYLIRDSNGAVCGFKGWTYNPSGGTVEYSVPASWDGPSSSCPSGNAYHGQTRGRYWRTDTQSYVTSGQYSISPSLNLS